MDYKINVEFYWFGGAARKLWMRIHGRVLQNSVTGGIGAAKVTR